MKEGGTTTMSKDSTSRMRLSTGFRVLAVLAALFLVMGFSANVRTVSAQDASPTAEASPTGAECDAPALPPGTPTPQEEGSPTAEDMTGMEMGSPEASAEASEEASAEATEEVYAGTAAEGDTADAIVAAGENLAACGNAGNFEGLAALMTENFMVNFFGSGNPYDVVAGLQDEGVTFGDYAAANPMTYEDGRVSLDAQYMESQYQLASERWFLVQSGEYWQLDEIQYISASTDLDQTVVGVNITETTADDGTKTYAFEPNTPSAVATELLTFHIVNKGTEVHETVIFILPDGADPMGLLDGTIKESDATFVGAIAPILPGGQADLNLVSLPAGVYTLVCFFPAEDGSPHLAHGMHTTFEVTAPAS